MDVRYIKIILTDDSHVHIQVTVTGGTGFIAGALIQQLLEKGYTVHATARSNAPDNPKTQHLLRLAAALPGELKLFEANLLTPGAFDEAVAGSTYVFHVASVVSFSVSAPCPRYPLIMVYTTCLVCCV